MRKARKARKNEEGYQLGQKEKKKVFMKCFCGKRIVN